MKWVKAPKLPDKLLRSYYCKIYNNVFKKEFKKQVLITLDGTWQTGDFDTVIEWLDESEPNEPAIQEDCHCTPDQTTGHTGGKCNVCGKEQEEGLEEAAEKYADSLHDKNTGGGQYRWLSAKEDFISGAEYSKQLNK